MIPFNEIVYLHKRTYVFLLQCVQLKFVVGWKEEKKDIVFVCLFSYQIQDPIQVLYS